MLFTILEIRPPQIGWSDVNKTGFLYLWPVIWSVLLCKLPLYVAQSSKFSVDCVNCGLFMHHKKKKYEMLDCLGWIEGVKAWGKKFRMNKQWPRRALCFSVLTTTISLMLYGWIAVMFRLVFNHQLQSLPVRASTPTMFVCVVSSSNAFSYVVKIVASSQLSKSVKWPSSSSSCQLLWLTFPPPPSRNDSPLVSF